MVTLQILVLPFLVPNFIKYTYLLITMDDYHADNYDS